MHALPRTAFCLLLAVCTLAGRGLAVADCGDAPLPGEVPGPDCDGDGVPDECEIAGKLAFSPATFSLGLRGHSPLVSGDLDGDGDTDLASLNPALELSLLLNTGEGLDFEARRVDLRAPPIGLAMPDLDGDGLADLVLSGQSSLEVFRNRGDAAFLPADEVPLPAKPAAVSAADLDGDGDLDLAVAGGVGGGFDDIVSVLTNEGAARFSSPRNLGVSMGARWLTARDLDADGDVDIAIACDGQGGDVKDDDRDGVVDQEQSPGGISILWNRGGGAFRPAETFDPGMRPGWIDAADLDGDGDRDLAAAGFVGPGQHLLMSFRNSGGTFEPGVTIITDRVMVLAALDDLDADGDPDLAFASATRQGIELLANDGSGRFSGGGSPLIYAQPPAFLLAADLDRDGDRDLAMTGLGSVVLSLFRNDGGLSFGRRRELFAGSNPTSVDALDLDRDGDLDLAVASRTSREVTFFWNDGAPDFRRATFHELAGDSIEIQLADLDMDGLIDIATASDALRIEWGEGPGRFGAVLEVPQPESVVHLALGDLDGDGRPDLAAAALGRILIYLNAGGRVFAPPRAVVTAGGPRAFERALIAGDLDGDGDLDLAAAFHSAGVQTFLNAGAGAFETLPVIAFEAELTSLGSADLDLDGDLDLMAATVFPNAVSLLWNRGDATFDVTSTRALPFGTPFVAAADLDGDRDPEIFTAGFHVLDNRADFEGVGWLGLSRGDSAANILARDLDGNGLPDLVSFTGSRSAIVFVNGSSPPDESDVDRDGIPDGCERLPFHRGDVVADGKHDLADAVSVLGFLFLGGAPLECAEAADADNDGSIVVSDAIRILGFLFLGGPPPAAPGPVTLPCGPDPDAPGSAADLGCAAYSPCL